jgi:hypothetical protein
MQRLYMQRLYMQRLYMQRLYDGKQTQKHFYNISGNFSYYCLLKKYTARQSGVRAAFEFAIPCTDGFFA